MSKRNANNTPATETALETAALETAALETAALEARAIEQPVTDKPVTDKPVTDKPVMDTSTKELAELMLKRAVLETDPKTVLLDAISLGDKSLPFLSVVVPSKKFKASNMGSVFECIKELAAKGKLTHMVNLASGTKARADGAKKLLSMLEAREKLNSAVGFKLLELLPITVE